MDAQHDFYLSYSVTFYPKIISEHKTSWSVEKLYYPSAVVRLLRKTWGSWLQLCSNGIVGERSD